MSTPSWDVSLDTVYHQRRAESTLVSRASRCFSFFSSQASEEIHQTTGTPREHLDRLITQLVEGRRDRPEVSQLHAQVLSDPATPAVLREQAIRYSQVFQDLLRRLIVEGQTMGEVRAADPDQLVAAVLAALDGLTRLALINSERFRRHYPDASIILGLLQPDTEPGPPTKRSEGKPR